jgi:hypothetical protein
MVRAWRQASKLDLAEPSLVPWLAAVARRIVINQKRRRSARPTETGDGMLENVSVADSTEDLLRKVMVAEAPAERPADTAVTELIRRRCSAQRHRARWQVMLAAAAGIVLIAGGIAVGIAAAPHQGKGQVPAQAVGQLHSGADAATGVAGTVGLVAKAWGTQVTLNLSKVRGPLECQLVAISRTGERQVITGWIVPAAGYGVPGHPGHLLVEGGTVIPENDLARVDVQVAYGGTLLSIPV